MPGENTDGWEIVPGRLPNPTGAAESSPQITKLLPPVCLLYMPTIHYLVCRHWEQLSEPTRKLVVHVKLLVKL